MDFKTIREFHWITKTVIALMGLFVGLFLIAVVMTVSQPNNYAASNGLGMIFLSLGWVLTQAFLVILVIILISMVVSRIKIWIEKYLDAMLKKLDTLAEQKAEREQTGAVLAIMNGKVEQMEKKLDNIERILKNVSD